CAAVLSKEWVRARGLYARVDPDRCAACLRCVRVCPFNVPAIVGNASRIEPVQCQGCGICVAECPNEAIHLIGYRKEQMLALLRAGLAEVAE
ncbi:MAG: 4Fe-4S binding protein, partial [Candidatus Desulforudis sp.]|nr:4Fe-4S binding protein [Desulforudis sp.]